VNVQVAIARVGAHALPLPAYETAGSSGMDLRARLDAPVRLAPGERRLIPTGFAFAVPEGFELQIRPRSGLALRHGIGIVNAPGTLDADYRGECGVLVINLGGAEVEIAPGMRIAQAVLAPVARCVWQEVDALPDTERGAGGFGSTGV